MTMQDQKPAAALRQLIHLALALDGTVLAHFLESKDAAAFCLVGERAHLPYNQNNRDRAPAPPVGAVYRM